MDSVLRTLYLSLPIPFTEVTDRTRILEAIPWRSIEINYRSDYQFDVELRGQGVSLFFEVYPASRPCTANWFVRRARSVSGPSRFTGHQWEEALRADVREDST